MFITIHPGFTQYVGSFTSLSFIASNNAVLPFIPRS
nr:MAG TPA: hypothetical protein [Caudoviricetes sp.]